MTSYEQKYRSEIINHLCFNNRIQFFRDMNNEYESDSIYENLNFIRKIMNLDGKTFMNYNLK